MAIPHIDVQPRNGGIEIAASVTAIAATEVQGTVTIERMGKSGSVNTNQGRALKLQQGQSETVATTALSFDTGDRLLVRLVIEKGGEVVGSAELRMGDP